MKEGLMLMVLPGNRKETNTFGTKYELKLIRKTTTSHHYSFPRTFETNLISTNS